MNNSEISFFNLLIKKIPPNYYIFQKMRIADIIKTTHGKGYYRNRNRILPKHVDFLICTKDMKPVLAIEIDGMSHTNFKRIERDAEIDAIFKMANMPIVHIKVGEDFDKRIDECFSIYNITA